MRSLARYNSRAEQCEPLRLLRLCVRQKAILLSMKIKDLSLSFSSSHKSQFEAQLQSRDHERVDACALWFLGIKVSDGREKLACGLLRVAEDVVQGLDLEDAVSSGEGASPPARLPKHTPWC